MSNELPVIIKQILRKIGFTDQDEIYNFINPSLSSLPHPSGMKGINEAVSILSEGIRKGTDIFIWGDYDVDGTTGTSLLITFFRELGIEPQWHIPNRLLDGYGLHFESFKKLHSIHSIDDFILVTVDCGISNKSEILQIEELGGRVIVTDHHQLPLEGVPGCVVLNPSQPDCDFNAYRLAGVGVAFYLAAALRAELDKRGYFADLAKPNMKDYLGFVALGTIADLVDLTPVNRTLVRAGMEALRKSNIPGLESLLDHAGLTGADLTSEDISFSLGPRINAAGRLGSADVAVDLLICDNHISGAKLSKHLDRYNERRKEICADNLESALSLIKRDALAEGAAIVVAGDYHSGVIGIVASKIIDIYGKPTIVFAIEKNENGDTTYKGSGRSVEGIDLLNCLHACSDTIKKYGGHAMAAGLTVIRPDFHQFKSQFDKEVQLARLNMQHMGQRGGLVIETSVDEVMDEENLKYLMKLEPFGPMNERPLFVDDEASIVHCKLIGSNREHLQVAVRGKYQNYKGVGFGLGDRYQDVKANPQRRISFYPAVNRYRGNVEWQLRIMDV